MRAVSSSAVDGGWRSRGCGGNGGGGDAGRCAERGGANDGGGAGAGYTSNPGNANTSGSNNTFIGYYAGPGTTTQLTNATAIGAQAVVSQSNSLVLGSISGVNGAASNVNVGIGTTTPTAKLHVVGDVLSTGTVTANAFSGGMQLASGGGEANL